MSVERPSNEITRCQARHCWKAFKSHGNASYLSIVNVVVLESQSISICIHDREIHTTMAITTQMKATPVNTAIIAIEKAVRELVRSECTASVKAPQFSRLLRSGVVSMPPQLA